MLRTGYEAGMKKSTDLTPLALDLQVLLQARLNDILRTCRHVSLLAEAVTFTTNYRHAWDSLLYSFAITKDDIISGNVMFVFPSHVMFSALKSVLGWTK